MSDFYTRPTRSAGRRRSSRGGYSDREATSHNNGSLFGWSIFILLLIGLAAVCWMGTIYIFGHPEQPLGYAVLRKFKKLDEPKRFIETAAPRGEFLDAKALLARYNGKNPRELQKESDELLRNYIRNYENVRGLVPYVMGRFTILDTYELTKNDFFPSGVVAVAQDIDVPQILIEQVFPADERSVPVLYRTLLTGTVIPLRRSQDLAPIIHIERLPDGRLKFTTVPIQYPNYSALQGPGSFALEPPATLNVEAGLPIFSTARMKEADERFASFRRKLARSSTQATPAPSDALMPVRPAVTTSGQTPVPAATPVPPAPSATPLPPIAAQPAQPAIPVAQSATPEPRVMPAIPVNGTPPTAATTAQTTGTDVPLKPFMATTQTTVESTTSGKWQTYSPGQMPRGRLVTVEQAPALAESASSERMYLEGDFQVTAAGPTRAVMRARGGESAKARVIVEYPSGHSAPSEGSTVDRGPDRAFLITKVERKPDGTVNIWAREVTKP
jgi:hypothetical protein